ncbi:MAG: class I SAM-dependent methyltransferase [Candidatus Methanofastidiosa archaeon]|nr:class I SAM-dependent methyltransferase [Candidatus Methanofastidiosa archaeon]
MTQLEDNYDYYASQYPWHGNEIMFGLLFEYLNKGQLLLDLGIGTGLSSIFFNKIGLKIYGVDNSEDMLKLCKKKGFTEELKYVDLDKDDIPFENEFFDFVISCGVFHFIKDLELIFKKANIVLKKGGIFCFTVKDTDNSDLDITECLHKEAGVLVYSHSGKYIEKLREDFKFEFLKKQKFLGVNNPLIDEGYFTAYVLKK